jgi:Cu/Ag efflux protein CusF
MPAMTMVFDVKDKAELSELKVGDKITFIPSNANGELTATSVKLAK